MSRVEKIVTSLEVSRKLKDLGIIQESCFYWCHGSFLHDWVLKDYKDDLYNYSDDQKVSAWTVTELGAMWGEIEGAEFTPDPEKEGLEIIDFIGKDGYGIEEVNADILKWINK